jgi:putative membrane protein
MPESVIADLWALVPTIVYFVVGLFLFGSAIWFMDKVAPFSIRKEIEEDHNSALAIVMGAALISLAIILAAALT